MTDKEKARAYDEALEKAQKVTRAGSDVAMDIVQYIFPQLTESDGERIRKEMVDYFSQYKDDGIRGVDITPWIAYLEKQEIFSKNGAGCYYYGADGSYTFIGLPGFEPIEDIKPNGERPKTENKSVDLPGAGLCVEKQKEQKPILEVFGFKVGDAVRLKDGDGRKHIIKSFEEVEGLHGPNFYHVEFEDNLARDGIYPGEEYPNGYYTQMEKFEEEQKPIDLSEMMVHKEPYIAPVPTPMVADEQKPDWSDEDKEALDMCLDAIPKRWKTKSGILLTKWLKDNIRLQLKQEWSEEDEASIDLFEYAIKQVFKGEDNPHYIGAMDTIQKLKSLRPSWEPSEEQMEALRECGECKRCIKELYEDIQKKRYGTS